MIFHHMIQTPTIGQLTEQGHLVKAQYYAPSEPDLKGLRIRRGDYEESGLVSRVDLPELVGDIVENFQKICPARFAVCFAVCVKHSIHIRDRFLEAGIEAAHIDANTPLDERTNILEDLANGEIQVVCNFGILTEGWDCPPVSAIILARPTKKLGLYLQMTGRALRPHPGKTDCTILDHAGAYYEHGPLDQDFPWDLDSQETIQERINQTTKKESEPITCPECSFIYHERRDCPQCGWEPKTKPESFDFQEGMLGKVEDDGSMEASEYTYQERKNFYLELKGYGESKNYKDGWAYKNYIIKFEEKPPWKWKDLPSRELSNEVYTFIRYRQILWAKRRK